MVSVVYVFIFFIYSFIYLFIYFSVSTLSMVAATAILRGLTNEMNDQDEFQCRFCFHLVRGQNDPKL